MQVVVRASRERKMEVLGRVLQYQEEFCSAEQKIASNHSIAMNRPFSKPALRHKELSEKVL